MLFILQHDQVERASSPDVSSKTS